MSSYIVGIDLGTTNTAVSSVATSTLSEDAPPEVVDFPVLQLTQPGTLLPRPGLPSFMYLASSTELPEGSMDLPWASGRTFMTGVAARERGAQVPLRMVSSAKSWLCHSGVNRRDPILPYQAPPEVEKLSPVAVASTLLQHLKDAWDAEHPDAPLQDQTLYLTVPASFDAAARDLTVEAARQAGLTQLTLLEEPQAAFYAWLSRVSDGWRERLSVGDRVLVCDVGGGTSDFTLIEAKEIDGALELERIAVGDHILLGGDNMDMALAHHLHGKLRADGKKLDAGQQRALLQAARVAKEKLLSDPSLESEKIVVLGRGSKLIGGKLKTELTRADLEGLLVEGFFPRCDADALPRTARTGGLMELGLPFAVEPAITKHLARFVAQHTTPEQPVTHLLFNGGVFNGEVLRDRLLEIIGGWLPRQPVLLQEADHDLAVARGAAYYGGTRLGRGIRIRGGTARSYYVGIESPAPAVPGVEPPINALCVVPFGMEEGSEAAIPGATLGLVVGHPVQFRFLSATHRKDDIIGTIIDEYTWPDELSEGAPLEARLEAEGKPAGTLVPVRLAIRVTEVGVLEVWCVEQDGPGRWRLEFSVRDDG